MGRPVEKFLYRVFSDDSNGSNESHYIAPQVSADIHSEEFEGLRYDDSHGNLRDQLHDAIMGYDTTANPFTFWTSSFLCALLHALKKQKAGQKGVRFICIQTSKAKNGDGDSVAFKWLPSVIKQVKMRPLRARWTGLPLDFADVWITTDVVMISDDSMKVSLSALISDGLCGLLPELGIISRRAKTGLATPVADLRRVWYRAEDEDLSLNQITLAAQLAMAFKPVSARYVTNQVPTHLFAWFLALRAQDPEGVRLTRWLQSYSSIQRVKCVDGWVTDDEATLESNQWTRLYVKLQEQRISSSLILRTGYRVVMGLSLFDTSQREEQRYKLFKKWKRESGESIEDMSDRRERVRLCIGG